ncbi:MAG: CDP-alcohol phosphatidyltransferase family protein [Verrucomicrobiales bacterium]|jgi:CDP-diacylglycerol--glycerol-3-phosphate 3-phosphatidyltransferase/cardiolipin synthase|nr:CDP-alcohol phosphatidyltransferase family protein [Verrucomicrobiales bacterium]
MTLATRITILRILLIPPFVGALLYYDENPASAGWHWLAVGLFILAALSDAVDGWLARRFRQRSELGAVLDPLADKALLLATIITLALIHVPGLYRLPLWFLTLVLGRDAILLLGFAVLHWFTRHVRVQPHWSGKVSTALQMTAVSLILLKFECLRIDWWVRAAGVFTAVSLMVYIVRGVNVIKESGCGTPSR